MKKRKMTAIALILLLTAALCLYSLRSGKPKEDKKETDKGSYTFYTDYTDSGPDSREEVYFYGK